MSRTKTQLNTHFGQRNESDMKTRRLLAMKVQAKKDKKRMQRKINNKKRQKMGAKREGKDYGTWKREETKNDGARVHDGNEEGGS